MSKRDSKIFWIRDTLEHLSHCQEQLDWADNPDTIQVLTESMIRDLESCRRVCEDLRQHALLN